MVIGHRIKRFLALGALDRQIFLRAMALLPVVSLRMKILNVKGTLNWLGKQSSLKEVIPTESEPGLVQVHRTAGLVRQAIFYSPIKGSCLSQSIVLWHLLRCQGIEGEVCIGVNKKEKKLPVTVENFKAHAWVEYKGEVLNDQPDVRKHFVSFEQILAPPSQNENR